LRKMEERLRAIMKKLSEDLGEDFVERHKEEIAESRELAELLRRCSSCQDPSELTRFREYRDLLKRLKRVMYYERRRFSGESGGEVSTEERGERIGEVVAFILKLLEQLGGRSVLDIGCGEFPKFLLPKLPKGTLYIAVDSRKKIVEELSSLRAEGVNFLPVLADAAETDFEALLKSFGISEVDLTLLLRTLRVLQRTRRVNTVDFIESVPSRAFLISEPLKSLVKGGSIERREKRFLSSLARELEERGVFAYHELFQIGDELFLLLK